MSFRQRIQDSIDSIWVVLTHHENNVYGLQKSSDLFRKDISGAMSKHVLQIHDLQKDVRGLQQGSLTSLNEIGSLQERVIQLMRDQNKDVIEINKLKNQITDLKQEICGLKTGHEFEYKGDIGPQHMFTCKLCGYLVLKVENELTPTERKALQTLGILNEPKKDSDK